MATLDWVIVLSSILLVLAAGVWGAKSMSLDDYWVNGRNTPTFMLFATTVATYVGVGAIMSNAAFAYSGAGLATLFYLSSFLVYLLLFANFIAPRIKDFGDKHKAYSIPDFFELRFSRRLRIVSLVLVLLSGSLWLALQILGLASFVAVYGKMDSYVATAIGGLVVVIYSAVGGLRADIRTDLVQLLIMAVLIVVFLPVLSSQAGGFEVIASLPKEFLLGTNVLPLPVFVATFFVFGVTAFTSIDLWQRAYAARSKQSLKTAMNWAAIVCFLFFVVASLLGVFAHVLLPNHNPDAVIPELLETYLPPGLRGLVIAGFIAAIMSSADSYLLILSMTLVHDLYQCCLGKTIREDRVLLVSRVTTLVVGVIAVGAALVVFSLFHLAVQASSFAILLTPAIVMGFLWKRVTERGAFWGTIIAGAVLFLFMLIDPLTAFIPAIAAGFFVVWLLRSPKEAVVVSPVPKLAGSNQFPGSPIT